jgi:flavin reductase (DIM6/NTAB) family NADH-FMN oxidoreductase RutF
MLNVIPSQLKVSEIHQYMLDSIAPRPIAFVSTIDKDGHVNLSPFSFFNAFGANPPILIFSPALRGRDGATKNTLDNIKDIKECVVNIVDYKMVQQMSLASTEYPKGVNEFVKAGLTEEKSELVKPPRVKEAPVQMECIVRDVISTGEKGGAGQLVICEIVMMHINEDVIGDDGRIDPIKIDQVARMGGNWYSRAAKGLFSIPKPLTTLGIGVDQLPTTIKNSSILTGNDLGILGNSERTPSQEEISEFKNREDVKSFLSALEGDAENLTTAVHIAAHKLLSENKINDAWLLLMCIEKS